MNSPQQRRFRQPRVGRIEYIEVEWHERWKMLRESHASYTYSHILFDMKFTPTHYHEANYLIIQISRH